ncbi:heat stress transcription factor C-1b-like [Musa acuminata AAA Group]|uniref:heat stress transcription factor C-1b-like n=1 Tax=Musa acuminata AAA Group TaxID=214697 RepID=UPI0031E28F40
MEEIRNTSVGYQVQAAPFVAKTYEMVNDPRTDCLIRWGKGNNSFVVVNPSDFSQFLLPSYFKHSNFSSFVRQLNTYGFRKVDPDRWEFAHHLFLRGQIHLLPHVIRRSKKSHVGLCAGSSSSSISGEEKGDVEGEVEKTLLQELYRLRQEQRALDDELQVMSRRLQATERRPHQMMSFLIKMAEDPESFSGLVISKKQQSAAAKKRRLVAAAAAPPAHAINDGVFLLPSLLVPGTEQTVIETLGTGSDRMSIEEVKPFAFVPDVSAIHSYDAELGGLATAPEASIIGPNHASGISFLPDFALSTTSSSSETAAAASFPFSLLGHGFC